MNALMGMFGAGAPVSKGDKNVDAMSLVSSEFRHMKFQYGPEMIDQMYTAFQRPVYNKIETTTEPIRCFCIDKDGFSVISSDKDLFSSRKPKTIKTDHKRSIRRLAVWDTNDKLGPQVITASNDSTLKVYDYEGKYLRTLEGHTGRVTCVQVTLNTSYEDTVVVSGGIDKTVRLWSLKTGKVRKVCEGHQVEILSVAFLNARYDQVVAASIDMLNEIRIWHKDEGICLRIMNMAPRIAASGPSGKKSTFGQSFSSVTSAGSAITGALASIGGALGLGAGGSSKPGEVATEKEKDKEKEKGKGSSKK